MKSSRRPTLPRVLSRAVAAGALALVACENDNAAAQAASSNEAGAQQEMQNDIPGDASRGEKIYVAKCGACHSVDQNRIGPKHRNVYGRAAGGVEDYDYSSALANSGIVWDAASLDEWLAAPTRMVPGTRMGLALSSEQDRRDVIAYLKSISE